MSFTNLILIILLVGLGITISLMPKSIKNYPLAFVYEGQDDYIKVQNTSEIGQQMTNFELDDLSGKKVRFYQISDGKPVIIDFWAAWTPFSATEMPELEKIQQQYKDKLLVIGVHRTSTESDQAALSFVKKYNITYTILKDQDGAIYKALTGGRSFMPYTVYIDVAGKIVGYTAGPKTAAQIKEVVEKLVQ